jgi:UDP-N-acetylglucosamine/UDP-N-acetylgalactosamine diphosphorylase
MTHASALSLLARHNQSHLLRFWDELDDAGKTSLLADIASIDFELVGRLHGELVANPARADEADTMAARLSFAPLRGQSPPAAELAVHRTDGLAALARGECAAFLVAGGQGTRLGHDGPKGVFDIGLPSKKSLFQLQAERLIRLGTLCGRPVPWYIMTSRDNHEATTAFFAAHGNFGLAPDQVMFFPQAEFPLTDADGKILLAEKGRVALGPNGNGGCFPALKQSGALDDMRRRGVEWVFFYSVDNALVRVCDPEFLGFAQASGLPAASKAVPKAAPDERVGVFCLRDSKPSVIEYSEMTPDQCAARDKDGLLFGSANIAVHLFRRDFLEQNADADLPWHVAHKKIPHVDASGNPVNPSAPNAHKFELFMFDLFPRAPGMAVLNVDRSEEFAPVKNRDGADSPATARTLIQDLHRRWALATGIPAESLQGVDVEVSPLTSYAGEALTPASFHRDEARKLLWA